MRKLSAIRNTLLGIGTVFLLVSIVFASKGFDKKDSYYNSDSYYAKTINAYVGGDAYNYIINAGYFAGYCAMSGACLASAAIFFSAGLLVFTKESTSAKEPEPKPCVEAVTQAETV